MIDSDFIIKYTDALYSVTEEIAPRYDEFRDMFSSGQVRSKEWAMYQLSRIDPNHYRKKFVVVGSWYGTLGMLIKHTFPTSQVTMVDIDPRCEQFIQKMIWNDPSVKAITQDMHTYKYTEDYIINTACEHIPDLKGWLKLIPPGKTVILQSNNYFEGDGHINCVKDKIEFIEQAGLDTIIYNGKLDMPMYTRFMIIGKT